MSDINAFRLGLVVVVIFVVGVSLTVAYNIVGKPYLKVWQQRQEGMAILARADQERQVLVSQAAAERAAAVERAAAIKIMGQAAKDFPEYRQQEFMAAFAEATKNGSIQKIIYVPTEANIPIMEAGRH